MEYERTMSEYLFLIAVVLLLAFLTERGYVGDWNSRGTRAARSIFIFVIFRVNPKFCVNPFWGANRAKFIRGGSRLVRRPPYQQNNA